MEQPLSQATLLSGGLDGLLFRLEPREDVLLAMGLFLCKRHLLKLSERLRTMHCVRLFFAAGGLLLFMLTVLA
eukprot:8269956-Prorocentrum_lima.AAC.1